MNIKSNIQTMVIGVSLMASGFIMDGSFSTGLIISDAEARMGRPATPRSVAGVSRRTTRRVIRRTSRYVATLPRGCTTVVVDGTKLHHCGSSYYQAHNNQYVIVNVD